MVEKLSKEQQAEYTEDIEYYEESRSKSKPSKKERHEEPDWDTEIHSHEKQEKVRAGSNERLEREEMREEMEYHEQYHQTPREKVRKESSAPEYEVHQPGHGQTVFLSPFEISQYKEEIEYRGKNHAGKKSASPLSPRESMGYELSQPGHGQTMFLSPFEISEYKEEMSYTEKNRSEKKKQPPLTLAESFGFETGSIMHGEEHAAKKMPRGMFGYDLELGYHDRTHPWQESNGEKLQRWGRKIGGIRDDLYGYRDYNSRNYTPTQFGSLDFGAQQKSIRSRPLHHSNVGRIDFFRDTRGRGLMSMDPFHLSSNTKAKPGRKKRGRPAGSRSSRSDGGLGGGLPPSLAWMF